MSKERNPLTRRYLEQLDEALDRTLMRRAEREAILAEIESHLAESVASGGKLTDALERLGPAEDLARAYAVELTLNPRATQAGSSGLRILTAATRASATLAGLLLVVVMGGLGLAFALTGALAVLAGLVAPFLPTEWMDPTLRLGLPQVVVLLIGTILFGVGLLSIRIVYLNARFLFGALRRDSRKDWK